MLGKVLACDTDSATGFISKFLMESSWKASDESSANCIALSTLIWDDKSLTYNRNYTDPRTDSFGKP